MNQLLVRLCIILFMQPLSQALALTLDHTGSIKHIIANGLTKPLPIFSHATIYQGLVHVSCIQGFLPATFELISPHAQDQAEQVLKNLKTVLEQANSSLDRVLKLTIFFADIDSDFAAVNDVINLYFPKNPPARSSIGVAKLPRGAKVVMECTAAAQPADG